MAEATESKGGHFGKLKGFSIAKLQSNGKALNLREAMAPLFLPPMSQNNLHEVIVVLEYINTVL